jgi:hypothetical protein
VNQATGHLLSTCQALGLIPSTNKTKQKNPKKRRREVHVWASSLSSINSTKSNINNLGFDIPSSCNTSGTLVGAHLWLDPHCAQRQAWSSPISFHS